MYVHKIYAFMQMDRSAKSHVKTCLSFTFNNSLIYLLVHGAQSEDYVTQSLIYEMPQLM